MLGRSKSPGRMLADPELLSLLDLCSCEVALQADRIGRGKGRPATRVFMEATHGT